MDDKALQNSMHQWLKRKNSSYQAEIHVFLQMWRKTVDKGGGYTETLHIYLISSMKQKTGALLFDEPVY
jgi:hypothetical protein